MMYRQLFLIIGCFCFTFISHSQSLELLDSVKTGFGHLSELRINDFGGRFFIVNRARDSFAINGHQFYVPPKDTLPGSPYRFGRSYVAGIPSNNNKEPFIHRPGGEILRLTDSSLLVFTTIYEDSVVTDFGTFINHAEGNGSNLLLLEYDYEGRFLSSKHWKSTYDVQSVLHDAAFYSDRLFLVGRFTAGRPNQFLELDENTLHINSNGDCFFGELNDVFEFEQLIGIYGDLDDYIFSMAVNRESRLLITGSSTSQIVNNISCPLDTITNPSLNPWRSTFMYMNQFSADFKCLESKNADFDFDGGLIERTVVLSDGSYLIYGVHGAGYLQYDDVRLENPDYNQSAYLFKFSADLKGQCGLQLDGGSSSTRIALAVDVNDQIWMCGLSSGDTLEIGDNILTRGNTTSTFWGFLAKLDAELNVLQVKNMGEEECREIIKGDDDEMYLRTQVATGHERVYRIVDSVSSVNDHDVLQDGLVRLYPNPAHDILFYQIDPSQTTQINEIQIFYADGTLMYQTMELNQQNGIELKLSNGLYFVNFIFSDGKRISKKIVVHK